MKEAMILATCCLFITLVLSEVLNLPCQKVKDGLCGKGQHVSTNDLDDLVCVDCSGNTFMDYENHNCRTCKSQTQPHQDELIARQGNSTSDNVIVCRPGFYRTASVKSEIRGKCNKCSVCEDGTWTARGCGTDADTVCCRQEMVATFVQGDVVCAPPNYSPVGKLPASRQERSPLSRADANGGGNELPNSGPSDESNKHIINNNNNMSTVNELINQHIDSDVSPQHSYSTGEEHGRKKHFVEIPMWGRFIFVGIGVGIFVFYLGVGIPCNACGSLDKLRQLKAMISGNRRRTSDEESEKPMNPKIATAEV